MKNPAGRNVFREFLRTEYSEENMLFWLACEELKSECNKHAIDEKARIIYEDYISILSPKEVNLSTVFLVHSTAIINPIQFIYLCSQFRCYLTRLLSPLQVNSQLEKNAPERVHISMFKSLRQGPANPNPIATCNSIPF